MPDELADILKKHAEWLHDWGPNFPKLANDPRRANLWARLNQRFPVRIVLKRGKSDPSFGMGQTAS